jgi:hypothetical protein
VRENRTHGSEGGDGESRFRPLSGLLRRISLDTRFRGYDGTQAGLFVLIPKRVFSKELTKGTKVRITMILNFVFFVPSWWKLSLLLWFRLRRAGIYVISSLD